MAIWFEEWHMVALLQPDVSGQYAVSLVKGYNGSIVWGVYKYHLASLGLHSWSFSIHHTTLWA
jgi:hypothetical protein